jgi:protein-disulfide isomerase
MMISKARSAVSPRMHLKPTLPAVVALSPVVLGLAAAGCGSSATKTASFTPPRLTTEATASTTATSAPPASTGPPAFVVRGRTSEGYEATMEGRFGTALKPSESDVDKSVLSECAGANGHELVVRLDVRVTLLSSITTNVELGFGTTMKSRQQVETVMGFSQGPSCTSGDTVNLGTMQPHTSKTFTAWVVLLNAISPDHPQPSNELLGEEWWYGSPWLSLNAPSGYPVSGQNIASASGPRAVSCEGERVLVPAGTPPDICAALTPTSTSATPPSSASPATASATVEQQLAGIRESGNAIGDPEAPVRLQFFGDLECPVCREFTTGALQALIQKWVRTDKLRIEYRSLETSTHGPEAFKTQQVAALAAGGQDKLWYFVELFYHEQGEEGSGYVTESYLRGLASQVPGLNLSTWSAARNDPAYASEITADARAAKGFGFTGTPSFLIGTARVPMKTFEYSSLTDPTSFNEAIAKLLKG